MADVTLWKKNESIAQVDTDDGIAHALSEYFSFFVPGTTVAHCSPSASSLGKMD
mgnify:CR=1 FL=1